MRNKAGDWADAESVCGETNATIAVPVDDEELRVIKNTGAGNNFWLGLECQDDKWISAVNGSSDLDLSDAPEVPKGWE